MNPHHRRTRPCSASRLRVGIIARLVCLPLLLLTASCAAAPDPDANTYRPYRLAGAPPAAAAIPSAGLPEARFARLHLPGVELAAFAPLADLMRRAASTPAGFAPYRAAPPAACPPPPAADPAPAALLAQGQAACLALTRPERYVLGHPPGSAAFADLSSLDGLIAIAGRAVAELALPQSLAEGEMAALRRIAGKLRMAEIQAQAARFLAASASAAQGGGALPALRQRVAALAADWARVDRAGRAEAERERAALAAAGRERAPLPYPSLTAAERERLSMLLGGIYWRIRGGGLLPALESTQAARLRYNALPMAAIGRLNGGTEGWAAGLAIFSRIFEGWGSWMDMGRTPGGGDALADLEGMTRRGARQVGIAAALLATGGYDPAPLRAGGLQLGPVYYFAWERLGHLRIGADPPPPLRPFLEGPTAWGEFLGGAAISLGFARALLAGRPVAPPGAALERAGP